MEFSKNSKVYVAGHNGMVGSACWKLLKSKGYTNLVGYSRNKLDLRNEKNVFDFFMKEKPSAVILAAAKVGGILANRDYPYEFLLENLQIQNNIISNAFKTNTSKLIFLGSSCIYPKFAEQPLKEESILTGELEKTNEAYALAKISGVKLIESLRKQYGVNYISLMPTNLYGPNDNYDLNSSHVLPALIKKFHHAKQNNISEVTLWGSGKPLREFLHVDDLAKAILFAIENNLDESIYNVGSGEELSINELALLIQKIVGHKGKIIFDKIKPDGTPRKLLDSSKIIKKGWKSNINIKEGIENLYKNLEF
jgi:GDP-L-fucose synthase